MSLQFNPMRTWKGGQVMRNYRKAVLLGGALLLFPALQPVALADTLAGKNYQLTFFLGAAHTENVTQTICFRSGAVWDSPSYPITGRWAIKGSEFWVWGVRADNNESIEVHGQFASVTVAAGSFQNWLRPATESLVNNYGTFTMAQNTTRCSAPAAAGAPLSEGGLFTLPAR